jgi:hypothetical protein
MMMEPLNAKTSAALSDGPVRCVSGAKESLEGMAELGLRRFSDVQGEIDVSSYWLVSGSGVVREASFMSLILSLADPCCLVH